MENERPITYSMLNYVHVVMRKRGGMCLFSVPSSIQSLPSLATRNFSRGYKESL